MTVKCPYPECWYKEGHPGPHSCEFPLGVQHKPVRTFETGATRDSDHGKLDHDGFLSPLALERYAEYMHGHRVQPDGQLRASDNWQKGIPVEQYRKSLWRHFFDAWKLGRGYEVKDRITGEPVTLEQALCGVLFNAFGWLHEIVKARLAASTGDGE